MEPDELEAMLKRYEPHVPPTGFKEALLERTLATDRNRRMLRWKVGAALAALIVCVALNVESERKLAAVATAPQPEMITEQKITAFSIHLANGRALMSMVGS